FDRQCARLRSSARALPRKPGHRAGPGLLEPGEIGRKSNAERRRCSVRSSILDERVDQAALARLPEARGSPETWELDDKRKGAHRPPEGPYELRRSHSCSPRREHIIHHQRSRAMSQSVRVHLKLSGPVFEGVADLPNLE